VTYQRIHRIAPFKFVLNARCHISFAG